jgi:excisionase family DNA binding protein
MLVGGLIAWHPVAYNAVMTRFDEMATGPVGSIAMSVEVAARETGLSRARLFDLIRAGELPSVKVGRQRLVMREDLERFLTERRELRAS